MTNLAIPDRVLFFPVTPFDDRDRVDEDLLARHVAERVASGPGAVFAACGTGEFHALSLEDYRVAIRAAVTATSGSVPVLGGAGGPLGHALACARIAAEEGADGLLVMPPYLVGAPQEGLVAYVERIARESPLPLIAYHRANAQFTPASVARLIENPRVVGIKDGAGDLAVAQQFVLEAERSGRDVLFFNGLLTAEMTQAAYQAIGVPMYSSAAFAMAPRPAVRFFRALREGDTHTQRELLEGFFRPLVALRDETPGFAVSLVKAGVRLGGIAAGSVRAPLVDPTPEQTARLARILERGEELAA
ncbi:5-dehydro-4-deoxyglucarate dehydratase [Microbacterium excoecariae]|uniref:5-dehydro-4-deoxyglucarate dehydratase n=1 Tax=Microbacterium excoecariae TaxID=2715210 RepID=UPI00140C42B5|nr:5-dehydro-4-deoxyglucarate dehydratase [Microbacterium excoecariae]NHI17408.1 5-dehydro-4-deoxyglucarate dehydratase [Microbacterium excoecariae]